ncbi:MAG: hypothetical protein MZV63_09300 [Marinilabiliales bacterium]|nr:hypothetical protein [Marinilabiliales bacterium]
MKTAIERIHRDALIAQGYNFTFFTHLVETAEGLRWSFCFEYGFREAENGYLELRCSSSSYLEIEPEEESKIVERSSR